MPEHVNKWLEAYLDGELSAARLKVVEEHLSSCEACRNELEELQSLSLLLQETKPEFETIPAERFSAQVMLQLPRRKPQTDNRSFNGLLWWLVPGALLFIWLFMQTLRLTTGLITSADEFGLLGELSAYLVPGVRQGLWIATIIDLVNGNLSSSGRAFLDVLAGAEWAARALGSQILWQGILLLLYWSWMVIWFVRRQQQILKV